MVDYVRIINRTLDILRADADVKNVITHFRFGNLGKDEMIAKQLPMIYVTTPENPEKDRKAFSTTTPGNAPMQEIETEFHVVVLVKGARPEDAQSKLYNIVDQVMRVMLKNTGLRKPDGTDRLCSNTKITIQRRLPEHMGAGRGTLVEGMTVRMIVITREKR